jgi:hypothetical protein
MKYLIRALLPLYILFLFTVALPEDSKETSDTISGPEQIKVNIKMASQIEDRMPVEVDSVFENTIGRIYCWSSVASEKAEDFKIYHIWNYEGEEQSKVPIEITSPTFRAFTFQTILPEQTGEWTVYVVDTNYNVLGMSKFRIEAGQS